MIPDYNPDTGPDPAEWLECDEQERIIAIEDYHRGQGLHYGNDTLHAVTHAIVENQVAMGDEYIAAAKLTQLIEEGLCRHDAIHAIGSVLMEHMQWIQNAETNPEESNRRYATRLKALTAVSWYEDSGVPVPPELRAKRPSHRRRPGPPRRR